MKSVDFGFRGESKQAVTRQTGYNWSILSHQGWGGGPTVFLDSTGYDAGHQNSALPNQVSLFNYGSFFGHQGPQAWFINASLLDSSTSNVYSFLKNTESMGWGWVPYATQRGCPDGVDVKCSAIYGGFTPEADNISAGINDQKEDILAGYFQVNYAHNNFLGTGVPVDGNVGVRVVQTQDSTPAGRLVLPTITTACAPPGPCPDLDQAAIFVGSGGSIPLDPVTNTYTVALPSFNFRAHLTDQLQARLAFSQGMVRPDFSYTQNYSTLSFNFQGNGFAAINPQTGFAGNPNLKPMRANNYDASLEWYFAPTGSLSFAVFHKDLSDYFLTGPVPRTMTRNGVTYTFQQTGYMNGSKGKVEGMELAYQQFYDSLPGLWGGFGIAANYTKIYNSGGANPTVNLFETVEIGNAQRPLPLEGMSPDSYNIQLLYEKYGISGRLAYNWRSRFLLTSSAANVNQPVWSENYGQLDGSIFYTFLDHYKLGIQATNLLRATTILDVGYADFHPRYDWIETDRKVSLILRANW
jgi:TonB-dependent receptor